MRCCGLLLLKRICPLDLMVKPPGAFGTGGSVIGGSFSSCQRHNSSILRCSGTALYSEQCC